MGRQSLNERQQRLTDGPAAIINRRTAAVEQMNLKLKRKFTQIEKRINDLRAENLRFYYKIGELILDVKQNPGDYTGHDGTAGLKLIEDALSTQARTLRKAAAFAETYTPEELECLISLYHTETNYQLHWGHVSFLLGLPTQQQREQYAAEAVEKMWDPSALHDAIKRRTGREKSHGRSHAVPATVPAQIRQIKKITDQWVRKNATVWDGEDNNVFDNVTNYPLEQMDNELLADLQEIRELFIYMQEGVGTSMQQLDRVIEHVSGVILARDAAETAAREQGKERRHIDLGDEPGTGDGRKQGRNPRRPAVV